MLSRPLTAAQADIEWVGSDRPVPYPEAIAAMEERIAAIIAGRAPECVWLLEHPPVYTAGASAGDSDLIAARFPVFQTGRGGRYTYHGPGQRVAYVMLDLGRRRPDVRAYVRDLEEWLIRTLSAFGVHGVRREGRVGIWVPRDGGREDKIAAIGVRIRHWVTFHGVALNVDPELSHFSGLVPCGVADSRFGVTSLAALGVKASMIEVDAALQSSFDDVFGGSCEHTRRDQEPT
jgi:lipoyl(octanoyl) transferase